MRARGILLLGCAVAIRTANAEPTTDATTALAPRVELEVALGGAPTGRIGVRSVLRVGPHATGLALGGGLGLTGAIGSIGLDQPLGHHTSQGVWTVTSEYGVYATYSLGSLAPWSRNPFTTHEEWLHDGRYHWLDVGGVIRTTGGRYFISAGLGATFLVAHPDPIGVDMIEDEDLLWVFMPEGWTRQQRWGPVVWSSIGVRL